MLCVGVMFYHLFQRVFSSSQFLLYFFGHFFYYTARCSIECVTFYERVYIHTMHFQPDVERCARVACKQEFFLSVQYLDTLLFICLLVMALFLSLFSLRVFFFFVVVASEYHYAFVTCVPLLPTKTSNTKLPFSATFSLHSPSATANHRMEKTHIFVQCNWKRTRESMKRIPLCCVVFSQFRLEINVNFPVFLPVLQTASAFFRHIFSHSKTVNTQLIWLIPSQMFHISKFRALHVVETTFFEARIL